MPSRIKSKLLIVTVLSATLAVLAVIAPMTAAMYSVIFMGVSLFLAVFAWGNAKKNKELQYKISKFMTLNVLVVVGMFVSMSNIALGDVNTMLHYMLAGISGIIAVYAMALLFSEEEKTK